MSDNEQNKPEKKIVAKERIHSHLWLVRSAIEFIGKHPFATGLLGLLAVLGFIIAVFSYKVDRQEAQETTDQIATVQSGMDQVVEHIYSSCISPPCWSLSDLMRVSTVGRSKDFIDTKLPPAEFVRDKQFLYLVEGCEIRIEYRSDAVSYISAALVQREKTEGGEYKRISCPFKIPRIMHPSSYGDNLGAAKYSDSDFPDFPEKNSSVALRDVLNLTHDDIRLSIACIECGNYSDPYLEAYAFGSHAAGFIDFYFMVDYYGHPVDSKSYDSWSRMQQSFDAIGPDPDKYHFVETTDYCEKNIRQQIEPIIDFHVKRIGIGRGARVWSGPRVLFCR